jgi:D-3-phosphoglycerate dehydrogenase / 2-oxoglutarate reductase
MSSASTQSLIVTGADLAPQALALLSNFKVVFAGKTPQESGLIALCQEHNPVAMIVRYGGVSASVMDAAPALKVISKHGSGTDTIDKAAAQERGIAVRAAAGANAAAVAEHSLALMLACAKSVVSLNARMHAGHWDKATHKSVELHGRTVGLVGLGAIGQRFARMCLAMNMKVLAYDPYAKQAPDDVELVSLERLYGESDVISLHCPLTPDNKQMINATSLAQCKPGVILINTARGGLIDEAALLQALESGQVGSAALDSFAIEPMTTPHPFQGHDRLILSPHIGGVTADAYVNMGVGAAKNVLDALGQLPT